MPTDRSGRVIINPRVPIGLDDFAQLYTGEGPTVAESAARIHMDYPTEGKSHMSAQWNRLGMAEGPEQFFSDPANVAAALASRGAPSVVGGGRGPVARVAATPSVSGWPTGFANEDERNLAIDTGAFDPTFATPTKRLVYASEKMQALKSVSKIISDPEIGKIMTADPKRGRHIYSSITAGRDYDNDRAQVEKLRFDSMRNQQNIEQEIALAPEKFGRERFKALISQGAEYDPKDGKLYTWQYEEPEADPNALPGQQGSSRPVRKRRPATPEDQHIFETYYSDMMGFDAPPKPDPAVVAATTAVNPVLAQSMSTLQPTQARKVEELSSKYRATTGQEPSPTQKLAIIAKVLQTNNATHTPMFKVAQAMDAMGNAIPQFMGGPPAPWLSAPAPTTPEEQAARFVSNPYLRY